MSSTYLFGAIVTYFHLYDLNQRKFQRKHHKHVQMVLITDINYIRVILAVHLLSNFSGLTTVLILQEEIQN